MEPAQGRPPKLLEILQAVGIQTCRDVKMVWTSGSSLVEEYEVAHGRLTATIHAFWTMVSGRSHQEVQRATDAVIQDRASTVLIHAAPDPGEPVQADDHSGGLAFTTHLVSGADCRPPCPGEGDQGAEGGRLVLEDVLDLEALGLDTEQIQGPAVVQQLKETVNGTTQPIVGYEAGSSCQFLSEMETLCLGPPVLHPQAYPAAAGGFS